MFEIVQSVLPVEIKIPFVAAAAAKKLKMVQFETVFPLLLSAEEVVVPAELVGRSITVLEKSDDMTINDSIVSGAGITVTVTNNYGYAVIKLS